MDIKLGRTVTIVKIDSKININIIHYLHKTGIIAGKKIINKKLFVPIIEFKDYTRIWMLPEEIEFKLKNTQK